MRMESLTKAPALSFVMVGALITSAATAESLYTVVDLGTLGGTESHAYGINNIGQVVGEAQIVAGPSHAFLWEDGVMTDLGTLGGQGSAARDMNEFGQVAGSAQIDPDVWNHHAFLWEG
ncbi:unnamed protein product, partial [marine sediment metagenome]